MADGSSQEKSTVRQIGYGVKSNLIKIVATSIAGGIVAAVTAVFALILTLPGKIGLAPTGAVMAFDIKSGCPAGWSVYGEGTGRFIIGAADDEMQKNIPGYYSLDAREVRLDRRPFKERGGEQSHQLTVDEMPSHQHQQDGFSGANPIPYGAYPSNGRSLLRSLDRTKSDDNGTLVSSAGGDKPHNIMPPWIALWLCKKDSF